MAEWEPGLWPIYRLEVCRGIAVLSPGEVTVLSLHDIFQTDSAYVTRTKLYTPGVPT